jgi:16S rRNA (guanine966-N2)-methyltransferase
MAIRVIAGSAKGRQLKVVPGNSTRPIMDRVKESLFNIIGMDIVDSTFLDLFAGTGSVSIEALSRGAKQAILVENNRNAINTIKSNLEITHLGQKATIRNADVRAFIKKPAPSTPFDYIYVAPPQYKGLWLETLNIIDSNPDWIPEGTTVIVQIDPKEYDQSVFNNLESYDERRYGGTLLIFFARKINDAEEVTQNE